MSSKDFIARGVPDPDAASFVAQVQGIKPLALLVRVLPAWSEQHDTGVTIEITARPGLGGAALNFSFNRPELSHGAAQDLVDRLVSTSHLMDLENAVEALREAGAPAAAIEAVVANAEQLAAALGIIPKPAG